jgi:hypothetical protein
LQFWFQASDDKPLLLKFWIATFPCKFVSFSMTRNTRFPSFKRPTIETHDSTM